MIDCRYWPNLHQAHFKVRMLAVMLSLRGTDLRALVAMQAPAEDPMLVTT